MDRRIVAAVMAAGLIGFGAVSSRDVLAQSTPAARISTDAFAQVSTQSRPKRARARTRITVTPRYPYLLKATPYPTPFDIHYPGPGFVRQCTSWLAPEPRPSGTVIVPRMHCWWERG